MVVEFHLTIPIKNIQFLIEYEKLNFSSKLNFDEKLNFNEKLNFSFRSDKAHHKNERTLKMNRWQFLFASLTLLIIIGSTVVGISLVNQSKTISSLERIDPCAGWLRIPPYKNFDICTSANPTLTTCNNVTVCYCISKSKTFFGMACLKKLPPHPQIHSEFEKIFDASYIYFIIAVVFLLGLLIGIFYCYFAMILEFIKNIANSNGVKL